jgi:hypothetical protein
MMEAVRTSETSVDNHFTRQYNPEDSSEHQHLCSYENLAAHIVGLQFTELCRHVVVVIVNSVFQRMYLMKDERDWSNVSMPRLPAIVHAGSARGVPPDARELQVSMVKKAEFSLLLYLVFHNSSWQMLGYYRA